MLDKTKEDRIRPTVRNAQLIFERDSEWVGVLAYNAFTDRLVKMKPAPSGGDAGPWTDNDTIQALVWMSKTYAVDMPKNNVADGVIAAALNRTIDPPGDWLRDLVWDKTPRIDRLFVDYFGAENDAYMREVSRCFLIGAVKRVLQPGCKLDAVVVLEGKQGAYKSTSIKALFTPQWTSDSELYLGRVDAYQSLKGKWAVEFSEMCASNKKQVDELKAFISAPTDYYRRSYGRFHEDVPRRCVFVGTTNVNKYLADTTGNRRFWPVKVGTISLSKIRADRDHLFAEAVARIGEDHWLSGEALKQAEQAQGERVVEDAWTDIVLRYAVEKGSVTVEEVLKFGLELTPNQMVGGTSEKVGKILHAAGWTTKRPTENGVRVRRYFPPEAPPTRPNAEES